MKKNNYKTINNIDRILSKKYTYFLDGKEFLDITKKLNKKNYNVYYPYKGSEKVILYYSIKPDVTLFEIKSYNKLTHQSILGSILGLNIQSNYVGDIIIDNDKYYFYIISEMKDYIKDNLLYVGNNKIELEEINLDLLSDYERKYEENEVIVSSNRIDTLIAHIIKTNRQKVIDKIKNKEVILNYEVLTKNSYILKENDIFSIRKYGKFKYIGIINTTKSNNLVIKYLKYI